MCSSASHGTSKTEHSEINSKLLPEFPHFAEMQEWVPKSSITCMHLWEPRLCSLLAAHYMVSANCITLCSTDGRGKAQAEAHLTVSADILSNLGSTACSAVCVSLTPRKDLNSRERGTFV